jgi:hypothetical protein
MLLQSLLIPIEQIQCHTDQALKMYNMHIMNAASSSLDSQLARRMISISFWRDYTVVFTKKRFPNGFFCSMLGRLFLWSLAYPTNLQQLE